MPESPVEPLPIPTPFPLRILCPGFQRQLYTRRETTRLSHPSFPLPLLSKPPLSLQVLTHPASPRALTPRFLSQHDVSEMYSFLISFPQPIHMFKQPLLRDSSLILNCTLIRVSFLSRSMLSIYSAEVIDIYYVLSALLKFFIL